MWSYRMYHIYNSSSENMSDVADGTVSLTLSSPKYNAGCQFTTWIDLEPWGQFLGSISTIIAECARVTKDGGYLVLEVADTSHNGNKRYMSLAALYAKLARERGFSLVARHMALTHTYKGYEEPEHRWTSNFWTAEPNHSATHQIMVFRKGDYEFAAHAGQIFYYRYPEGEEGHPCPFANELIEFVLDHYSQEGDTVLDPCCGTARLGRAVIQRGGSFIGYDLSPEYCATARELLETA